MKLIENRISYDWRTYAKDKEYVKYKGKKYIVTRPYDPLKCNTFTLRKQAIAKQLVKEGIDISNISKITGVSESTIKVFLSEQIKEEHYSNSQKNASNKASNAKKVRVVCYTDNSITVYNSVIAAAEAINCSNSNISNYCKSGKVYTHKATKKEYRMFFIENEE